MRKTNADSEAAKTSLKEYRIQILATLKVRKESFSAAFESHGDSKDGKPKREAYSILFAILTWAVFDRN